MKFKWKKYKGSKRSCGGSALCPNRARIYFDLYGHRFYSCRDHKREKTFGGAGNFNSWLEWGQKRERLERKKKARFPRTTGTRATATYRLVQLIDKDSLTRRELRKYFKEYLAINSLPYTDKSLERFLSLIA